MRLRHVLPCTALAAASLVAGCGADDGQTAPPAAPATASAPVRPDAVPGVPPELQLPAGVPRRGDGGAAGAAEARVIRRWASLHRRGRLREAARVFALPSRFQNVTPILTIDTAPERRAIQESLTCGGRPVRMERAGRYVVVTFELGERPGARCGGTGVGRATLRVAGGRITEFYRHIGSPDEVPAPQVDPGRLDV